MNNTYNTPWNTTIGYVGAYSIYANSQDTKQGQQQRPPAKSSSQETQGKAVQEAKDAAKNAKNLVDLLDEEDMDDIEKTLENDPAKDYILQEDGQ